MAQSTKSYQCRCADGFRGQWCEVGRAKAIYLASLSPSSILAISMCLLVFLGELGMDRDACTTGRTLESGTNALCCISNLLHV